MAETTTSVDACSAEEVKDTPESKSADAATDTVQLEDRLLTDLASHMDLLARILEQLPFVGSVRDFELRDILAQAVRNSNEPLRSFDRAKQNEKEPLVATKSHGASEIYAVRASDSIGATVDNLATDSTPPVPPGLPPPRPRELLQGTDSCDFRDLLKHMHGEEPGALLSEIEDMHRNLREDVRGLSLQVSWLLESLNARARASTNSSVEVYQGDSSRGSEHMPPPLPRAGSSLSSLLSVPASCQNSIVPASGQNSINDAGRTGSYVPVLAMETLSSVIPAQNSQGSAGKDSDGRKQDLTTEGTTLVPGFLTEERPAGQPSGGAAATSSAGTAESRKKCKPTELSIGAEPLEITTSQMSGAGTCRTARFAKKFRQHESMGVSAGTSSNQSAHITSPSQSVKQSLTAFTQSFQREYSNFSNKSETFCELQGAQQQSEIQKMFEGIVNGVAFDFGFAMVIFMNTVIMALEIQYAGMDVGYDLGYPYYDRKSEDLWPYAGIILEILDKIFIVVFAIEIMLRIAAMRARWFRTAWSFIDATVVIFALIGWFAPSVTKVNPTMIRLARFGKLMRIVRVVQSSRILGCLKLLIAAITGSISTLFWSLCVIILIQAAAAMLLAQLVEFYIVDRSQPLDIRQIVFGYYGTFWRSLITMFEITFANWAPPCRVLVDNVSEEFGIFFLIYRCAIGFAVLNVIQAVFIQQTLKNAQLDDEMLAMQKVKERKRFMRKIGDMFMALDESGDGFVTWEEFEVLLTDPSMKGMLGVLEVDATDVAMLFKILDSGDGQISMEDFIQGIMQIKGPAKAIDSVAMLNLARRLESKVDELMLCTQALHLSRQNDAHALIKKTRSSIA